MNLGNPLLIASAASAANKLGAKDKKTMLITAGIVAAGVGILGYIVYKKVFGSRVDEKASEMEANLRNLRVSRKELTISEDEAVLIAQQIFDAMNRRGTDEETVIGNLERLKSKADLLYVIIAFGIKNYGVSGESDSWLARKLGYATPLNMSGWLKKEFRQGSSYYKRIETVYNRFNVPF
jgi:hypothetical protein